MATKLKQLKLHEVSLVDRGANQHAHVTLFKRDGDDGLSGKLGEANAALAKSVEKILSGAADETERAAELGETFKQYHDHVKALVDESVTAALAANTISKDDDMSEKIEDVKKQLDEANAALAKTNKELAFAKLSDAHKSYVAEKAFSDEDKDAFVAKSEAERDEQIKAAPVEKKVDPEIAKRDERLAELEKRLKDTEEKNAVAEFAKKATELGLPESEGETLRKAHNGDKASLAKLEGFIKGLTEQVKTGKLFEEFGTKQAVDATSPKAKVDAKVAELQKTDATLSRAQAVAKIASDPAQRELWNEYKAAGTAA